ncbi:MAG: hypothetical protein IJC48_03665 [Clostridia bacterium]|nr:hypothetical protein [Clostridia bacterium]
MKKIASVILALILVVSGIFASVAEEALKAFENLTGQSVSRSRQETGITADVYLANVMNGEYSLFNARKETIDVLTKTLDGLSKITSDELQAYAFQNSLPAELVRNEYFMALGNVLKAQIEKDPAAEEKYRSVQIILSLFLETDDDDANEASRRIIRTSITRDQVKGHCGYLSAAGGVCGICHHGRQLERRRLEQRQRMDRASWLGLGL